jgi:isoleucyl-tRNA synthetase
MRKDKIIGKGLDAKVELLANLENFQWLHQFSKSELTELFNVSQVVISERRHAETDSSDLFNRSEEQRLAHKIHSELAPRAIEIKTLPADGTKCERCWNYSIHVSEDPRWPTVCERCSAALTEMGVEAFA